MSQRTAHDVLCGQGYDITIPVFTLSMQHVHVWGSLPAAALVVRPHPLTPVQTTHTTTQVRKRKCVAQLTRTRTHKLTRRMPSSHVHARARTLPTRTHTPYTHAHAHTPYAHAHSHSLRARARGRSHAYRRTGAVDFLRHWRCTARSVGVRPRMLLFLGRLGRRAQVVPVFALPTEHSADRARQCTAILVRPALAIVISDGGLAAHRGRRCLPPPCVGGVRRKWAPPVLCACRYALAANESGMLVGYNGDVVPIIPRAYASLVVGAAAAAPADVFELIVVFMPTVPPPPGSYSPWASARPIEPLVLPDTCAELQCRACTGVAQRAQRGAVGSVAFALLEDLSCAPTPPLPAVGTVSVFMHGRSARASSTLASGNSQRTHGTAMAASASGPGPLMLPLPQWPMLTDSRRKPPGWSVRRLIGFACDGRVCRLQLLCVYRGCSPRHSCGADHRYQPAAAANAAANAAGTGALRQGHKMRAHPAQGGCYRVTWTARPGRRH